MDEVLHLFVLMTIGAIVAVLIAQLAQTGTGQPGNAKDGVFARITKAWSWAIGNAYGTQ